jgi:NADPH2:quinone reductase
MRAVLVESPGGAEKLRLGDVETPKPGPREVLIRVAAAGVNRVDIYQREGKYPAPPGVSPLLGVEVAGTIEALGAGVTQLKKGERVMALLPGGGYAEFAVAPAETTLPIPEKLDFVQAAGIPEAYFTVWSSVFDIGRLKSGEVFLMHGGASGIGSVAIPMARHFGARVFATAGSAEKCAACVELGAHRAINYREEDFVDVINREAEGADVILDMIGGDYFPRNLQLLRRRGRLVHIDFQHGRQAQIDLGLVIYKDLTVTGASLRRRPLEEKAELAVAIRNRLFPLIEKGILVPRVAASLPFSEAGKAHQRLETGANIGKVILTP